jgi:hypothetical protein
MIEVSLSDKSICDCCGREKLTKTFKIESYQGVTYLGYKCCARWFKLNMSGNKFQALIRLNYKIRHGFTAYQLDEIFCAISESETDWQLRKNNTWGWQYDT